MKLTSHAYPYTQRSAQLSFDRRYRYSLERTWDASLPTITWIGLNPSTADADRDDPTVRRIVGLSRRWGYGGIVLLNLFALRATSPKELLRAEDPVGGQRNDLVLESSCRGREVVLAWGAHGSLLGRGAVVEKTLSGLTTRLYTLGRTKEGHPKHPLYLPNDTVLAHVHYADEGT